MTTKEIKAMSHPSIHIFIDSHPYLFEGYAKKDGTMRLNHFNTEELAEFEKITFNARKKAKDNDK